MDTETYNSADDFEAAYAPLKQRVFVQLVKDIEAKREADASGIVNPANRSHKLTVAETMEFHRYVYCSYSSCLTCLQTKLTNYQPIHPSRLPPAHITVSVLLVLLQHHLSHFFILLSST